MKIFVCATGGCGLRSSEATESLLDPQLPLGAQAPGACTRTHTYMLSALSLPVCRAHLHVARRSGRRRPGALELCGVGLRLHARTRTHHCTPSVADLREINDPQGDQSNRSRDARSSTWKHSRRKWIPRITRQRGARTEPLFWQSGGGFDRNVHEPRTLLHMMDYIHLNPVRRGLVERAIGSGRAPLCSSDVRLAR